MAVANQRERSNDMRARITKLMAGLTVVAALAVGGAAFASAGSNPAAPSKAPVAAVDKDTLQQGDQSSPDTAAEQSSESTSPGQPEQSETADAGAEVPGNDGPGGHADEPGNPNADHQFDGAE